MSGFPVGRGPLKGVGQGLHWALLPLLQVGQFMFMEGVRVRLLAGGEGEVVDLDEQHVGRSSQR